MNKYSRVYDIVTRLTDDPALRAFFITYLLADSEQKREELSKQFWEEARTLEGADYQSFKDAYNRSFRQLLPMVNQLYDKVVAAAQAEQASRA